MKEIHGSDGNAYKEWNFKSSDLDKMVENSLEKDSMLSHLDYLPKGWSY